MQTKRVISERKKTLIGCLKAVLFLRNKKRAELGDLWRNFGYFNKDLFTLDWEVWALRREIYISI